MPPGSFVAGEVLAITSTIFISTAIALGIYALRSARAGRNRNLLQQRFVGLQSTLNQMGNKKESA